MTKPTRKKRTLPRLDKPTPEADQVSHRPEAREPTGTAEQPEVTMITIRLPVVLPRRGEERRMSRIDMQLIEDQALATMPVLLGCQESNARLLRRTEEGDQIPLTPIVYAQDVARFVFQEIWLAIDEARDAQAT